LNCNPFLSRAGFNSFDDMDFCIFNDFLIVPIEILKDLDFKVGLNIFLSIRRKLKKRKWKWKWKKKK
jgi:hypothetical protein